MSNLSTSVPVFSWAWTARLTRSLLIPLKTRKGVSDTSVLQQEQTEGALLECQSYLWIEFLGCCKGDTNGEMGCLLSEVTGAKEITGRCLPGRMKRIDLLALCVGASVGAKPCERIESLCWRLGMGGR